MGAVIFWVSVVVLLEGVTIVSRRKRRKIARYADSAELRAINTDGHERSNVLVAGSFHAKQR